MEVESRKRAIQEAVSRARQPPARPSGGNEELSARQSNGSEPAPTAGDGATTPTWKPERPNIYKRAPFAWHEASDSLSGGSKPLSIADAVHSGTAGAAPPHCPDRPFGSADSRASRSGDAGLPGGSGMSSAAAEAVNAIASRGALMRLLASANLEHIDLDERISLCVRRNGRSRVKHV